MADWSSLQQLPAPIVPLGGWDPLKSYSQAVGVANALDERRDNQMLRKIRGLQLEQAREKGLITQGEYDTIVNGLGLSEQPNLFNPQAPVAGRAAPTIGQPPVQLEPAPLGKGIQPGQLIPAPLAPRGVQPEVQPLNALGNAFEAANPFGVQAPPAAPQPSPQPQNPPQAPSIPQNAFDPPTRQHFTPGTDEFYREVGRRRGQQAAQDRFREQYKEYVNAGLKMMESDDPDTMQRGLGIVNQVGRAVGLPIQFPESLPNSQSYTDFSQKLQTILNDPKLSGPQKLQQLTQASLEARGSRQTEAARNAVNQPPPGYRDSGKTSGGRKVWLSPDGKKAWIEE